MLTLTNLSVRVAGRLLLDHANMSLPEGVKAGLVGRNGCGKTTLFNVIDGTQEAETGSVIVPKGYRLGRVLQEAPATQDSLIDIVLAADGERVALIGEADQATDPARIAEIQARLVEIDAHSAEARAARILAGLGFDEQAQRQPAASFSGGWRMRVALAAVLFARPDLLLLDEPTNYLDLEGTLWLESYVAKYPGTVVIISHDRDLLNQSVNLIVHFESLKLVPYRGGYDSFERQRAERIELEGKIRAKQEAKMAHMQAFVDRFRAKASKAKQAQSRIKALEKIQLMAAHQAQRVAPIQFPSPVKSAASPIIKLEGVSCGYQAEMPVLKGLNLNIDTEDRIALLGANGNGKSTFAKLLTGQLPFHSGSIVQANGLKVTLFAQHQLDDLRANETPVDHLRTLMPDAPEAKVRAKVADLGLGAERMDTKARDLSGGEKARLLLGMISFGGPDLLILDEPTNHLDVDSREALAYGLNAYTGAVILISHDRHLIDACVDRLWIVNQGSVNPYDGDLESYRDLVVKSPKPSTSRPEGSPARAADRRRDEAAKRQKLAPLKKDITRLETDMQHLQTQLQAMDARLSQPGLFERDSVQAAELMKNRASIAAQLESKEEDWLTLNETYEAALSDAG